MDADNCSLAATIISKTYAYQGGEALQGHRKIIKTLLSERRLPSRGWDDATIELFIQEVALMDSNNFLNNVGAGEREARVASQLVARRHYRLAHGIGRSGEVNAEQPKAAGSSLLLKLTNALAKDALRVAGLQELGPLMVLPLATGMTLTLALLALRNLHGSSNNTLKKYVLWPRIDQKTCLKCITAAGYQPVVVPMKLNGDQLEVDIDAIQQKINELGADSIACILTTTSCFAPRAPDDVISIAKLCQQHNIAHIINNAYGVQSSAICQLVTSACRKGRVDAIVQSTDKNFMVPVGGAILTAPRNRPELVDMASTTYPGRASMSPILDLLITLLHWGEAGWKKQLHGREELYQYALEKLSAFASQRGERVLHIPNNPISLAMTLSTLTQESSADSNSTTTTFLGSMLFTRFASGARVVAPSSSIKQVTGIDFKGYGAHYDEYPESYVTLAAAIGTEKYEIDEFIVRLGTCMTEFQKKAASPAT